MPRSFFHKRPRGVSLVELLVAVTILLLVSMACVQVIEFNTRTAVATFKRIEANQLADQIVNHLRRSNVAKLEDHYRSFPQILTDPAYSAAATVGPALPDGSRAATVVVRWGPEPDRHFVSVTVTLVST